MDAAHLSPQATIRLAVSLPFDFRHTFWKPSHFATALEIHSQDVSWRTFRIGERTCGARFEMDGDHVAATIFSDGQLTSPQLDEMARRISYSYGLGEDISGFLALSEQLPVMRAPLALLRGMRQSCPENLFEIAIISLLLQNATIGRTRQMMDNLLRHHGHVVTFDGVRLRTFFTPGEIAAVGEMTHREVNRLGYRAKFIPRFAEFFLGREGLLSADGELLDAFQQIKGVGPYTRAIVASHASRDTSALGLDVWNRKILARRLLSAEDAEPAAVMSACSALFPGYEGLAALYLVEHEYSSRPAAALVVDPAGETVRALTS